MTTTTITPSPATPASVASGFLTALDTDFDTAWLILEPHLRRTLVRQWIAANLPHLEPTDAANLAGTLATAGEIPPQIRNTEPAIALPWAIVSGTIAGQFAGRWYRWLNLHRLGRLGVSARARPVGPDREHVVFVELATPGQARIVDHPVLSPALVLEMHLGPAGWQISDLAPVTESPAITG